MHHNNGLWVSICQWPKRHYKLTHFPKLTYTSVTILNFKQPLLVFKVKFSAETTQASASSTSEKEQQATHFSSSNPQSHNAVIISAKAKHRCLLPCPPSATGNVHCAILPRGLYLHVINAVKNGEEALGVYCWRGISHKSAVYQQHNKRGSLFTATTIVFQPPIICGLLVAEWDEFSWEGVFHLWALPSLLLEAEIPFVAEQHRARSKRFTPHFTVEEVNQIHVFPSKTRLIMVHSRLTTDYSATHSSRMHATTETSASTWSAPLTLSLLSVSEYRQRPSWSTSSSHQLSYPQREGQCSYSYGCSYTSPVTTWLVGCLKAYPTCWKVLFSYAAPSQTVGQPLRTTFAAATFCRQTHNRKHTIGVHDRIVYTWQVACYVLGQLN